MEKQEGGHMVGVHPAGPGELEDESAPTWSVSELRPRAGRQRPACGCGPPRAGYGSCSLPPSSHWGCFGEDPGNLGLRPLNAEAQHSLLPRAKCSQGSRKPQELWAGSPCEATEEGLGQGEGPLLPYISKKFQNCFLDPKDLTTIV